MNISLQAMSIELPRVARHPNRLPFRGVLALIDVPSDKPPSGARAHRVLMPRAVAERALPSLLGMALDYVPALDAHDARRKVGVITQADVTPVRNHFHPGRSATYQLEVGGYIYARDFPDVVEKLRAGAELGMSYEISDAWVADPTAHVWVLTNATFTGAAVLLRSKAAYARTWIEVERASGAGERMAAAG